MAQTGAAVATHTVAFVDATLPDWEVLAAELPTDVEVILLNAAQDGVLQIAAALADRDDLDAIHVLSHGRRGALQLGNAVLDEDSLPRYQSALQTIGAALSDEGDLLLYGCNVAIGDAGHAFVEALAVVTGADVAASVDLTGAEVLGGNWNLEVTGGSVQATPLGPDEWSALLAVNTAPHFPVGDGSVLAYFIGHYQAEGRSVVLQPDGKMLVGGRSDDCFAVLRVNADGSFDSGFSGGGVATDVGHPAIASGGMALEPDGQILLAGTTWNAASSSRAFTLIRCNANGSLDTGFGDDGVVTLPMEAAGDSFPSVALQRDGSGRILLGGDAIKVGSNLRWDFVLACYDADGSLDTSFGNNGIVTTDVGGADVGRDLAVQADGKILLAGHSFDGDYEFALLRYNDDGSLDTTFSDDGKLTTPLLNRAFGTSVVLQPDGKILLGGYASHVTTIDVNYFALVRYNYDGTLDTTFSVDGKLTTIVSDGDDRGYSVTLQPDGKIILAGYVSEATDYPEGFALVRYNADGSVDTSFGELGTVITPVLDFGGRGYSVELQPDGKILVAGDVFDGDKYVFALIRYNSDGSLDNTFDVPGAINGAPRFTEGGPAIVLDGNVQVIDAELAASGNYAGASLTLARHGGASAQDAFSSAGSLAFTAGKAVLAGVTIGTVSNAGGQLVLTFNTNATQARVNQALGSIAYSNSSSAPPDLVKIEWTFSDGNTGVQGTGGALSATGSTWVVITAVGGGAIEGTPGNDVLNGTEADDEMLGHAGADSLTGGAGNDWLDGGTENDTLNGGAGADTMVGGAGDDTYVVDDPGDVVSEAVNSGTDTVNGSVTYTLFGNVERLTLTGASAINGTGNSLANVLNGNAAANTLGGGTGADTLNGGAGNDLLLGGADNDRLVGNDGNDTLDGWARTDTMVGGLGNDIYVVDNPGDVISEGASGGTDLVKSSVTFSFAVAGRAELENLTLTGTSAINGTGNAKANVLTGNSGANILNGGADNDRLYGGNGNDTLDGGTGADTIGGGLGDDTYLVDNAGDVITEAASGGTDLVKSAVTFSFAVAGRAELENLSLTGTSAINGTGNAKANVLTGNSAANVLSGVGGTDRLYGADGNDTLLGGAGADTLVGGLGADRFKFLTTGEGVDSITDFASGTDKIQVVSANFGGLPVGTLLAGNFRLAGQALPSAPVFVYDSAAGSLTFDADGSGATAAVALATLTGPKTLVRTDIVIVAA
jgi:uncharacterized delta-60 repeat protein